METPARLGFPSLVTERVEVGALERRRRVAAHLQRADRPQVAEDAVAERRLVEVVDTRAAARAGAAADDALDHARVALAEDHEVLLELDQRVEHLARPGEQRQLAVGLD